MNAINNPRKLAQLLLKDKKIDRTGFDRIMSGVVEAEKARKASGKNGGAFPLEEGGAIKFVVDIRAPLAGKPSKLVTEEDVQKSVAKAFGLPYKKIDPLDLDIEIVTRTIPKPFALKHMVLPLYEREGVLSVAVVDPELTDTIEGIARATGKKIEPIVSTPGDIRKIIHEFFGFRVSVTKAEEQISKPQIDLGNLEQLNRIEKPEQIQSDDEHIKNAVDYLFNYAFDLRASDIHIEPKRDKTQVRFRIDGLLSDVYDIPKGIHLAIASRIKMLARMNIAEKRRAQDGRIRVEYGGGSSELRVSSMPTAFGEKLVLRALRPETLLMDMDSLGFFPEELIKVERFLNRPHGIVLVTGPTGSGKTTTLYSALNFLSTPEKNIITIEDPIETICEKFNQVGVQHSIGLTFASALRTILRQDPDIIMIGEIRDNETAENAVQAALTGHLVLSTLHTNDTTSSLTRLLDLGIKPFLINNTIIGVVAQRLLRVNCPHCSVEKEMSRERLALFGVKIEQDKITLREGKGCEQCRFTGFMGRTAVYEVLEITGDIRKMIQDGDSVMSIRKLALSRGMNTLRHNAIRKMLNGQTALSEVLRMGQFL